MLLPSIEGRLMLPVLGLGSLGRGMHRRLSIHIVAFSAYTPLQHQVTSINHLMARSISRIIHLCIACIFYSFFFRLHQPTDIFSTLARPMVRTGEEMEH
jgi:hypothetical protein